jgi:hypothetical protein
MSFMSSELKDFTSSSCKALNAHVTMMSCSQKNHLSNVRYLGVVRMKCFSWFIRHLLLRNVWQYIETVFSLCGSHLCSKQEEEHCTKDCTRGYGYFSSFNHMHMACMQVKR